MGFWTRVFRVAGWVIALGVAGSLGVAQVPYLHRVSVLRREAEPERLAEPIQLTPAQLVHGMTGGGPAHREVWFPFSEIVAGMNLASLIGRIPGHRDVKGQVPIRAVSGHKSHGSFRRVDRSLSGESGPAAPNAMDSALRGAGYGAAQVRGTSAALTPSIGEGSSAPGTTVSLFPSSLGSPGLGGPILLGSPALVVLAEYPFIGNSPASTDTEPHSGASDVGLVGLGGTLNYSTSGTPGPALRISAQDTPGAFDSTEYLTFSVTPNSGYQLSLDSLSFDIAQVFIGGGYSLSYALRSSVDGFASDILTGSVTTTSGVFSTVTADLSGAAYQGLTGFTARLYLWDGNNGANNYILLDNIILSGATAVVPEPEHAAVVFGLSLLGWLPLRKRTPPRAEKTPRGLRPLNHCRA